MNNEKTLIANIEVGKGNSNPIAFDDFQRLKIFPLCHFLVQYVFLSRKYDGNPQEYNNLIYSKHVKQLQGCHIGKWHVHMAYSTALSMVSSYIVLGRQKRMSMFLDQKMAILNLAPIRLATSKDILYVRYLLEWETFKASYGEC